MKTNTQSVATAALNPIAETILAQGEQLLEGLRIFSTLARKSPREILVAGQALASLSAALAMPEDTRRQRAARIKALKQALPSDKGEAYCLACQAGTLMSMINAFDLGILQSFEELVRLREDLKTVYTAYWESTENAGPSWWHR